MVVLDTCAIIEAYRPSPSFSKKTLHHIDEGAYVLSVSFAEIACKIKLKKLDMGCSARELYLGFSRVHKMKIVDIGVGDWLDSIDLDWPDNKDPADRLITAFAIQKQAIIVTSDKKIAKFYNKVLW